MRESCDWTGVILAGGQSSRMGQDKALLPWNGRPLLEHMQGLLRDAGASKVIINGEYPQYEGVADAIKDLGPIGGLATVADRIADGLLLVIAVDMPLLSSGLLRELIHAEADACTIYHGHPLPMRLRLDARVRACLGELAQVQTRQRSLHALHAALGGSRLALPAQLELALSNCNTPQQWQAAQAAEPDC